MANPSQIAASTPADKEARLDALRRQFDGTPYPWLPLEKRVEDDVERFYEHSIATAFYYRDHRLVNTDGMKILDVGCGSGYKALVLAHVNPGTTVVGVDLSPRSVEVARQRAEHWGLSDRLKFHVLNLDDLPQLGQKFDYINCDETLYLCPDPSASLQAIASVLNPQGILRVNLHDYYQRRRFLNAQTASQQLDPDALPNSEEAINNFLELAEYLAPNTFIGQSWKNYSAAAREQKVEVIQANFLLQCDRGFTVDEAFDLMDEADLHWFSMVAPQRWDWKKLFVTNKPLPDRIQATMDRMSDREKLALVDLLIPENRLIDWWCSPTPPVKRPDVAGWTLQQWESATIACHPVLQTEKFYQEMATAARSLRAFSPKAHFHTPQSITGIGGALLPALISLKDGAQPFGQLVERLRQVHPLNPLTQEPVDPQHLADVTVKLLAILEQCGYLFVWSNQPNGAATQYQDPWAKTGAGQGTSTLSTHFGRANPQQGSSPIHHRFLGLLGLATCGILAGAENWAEIQNYGEAKADWLASFLGLTQPMPSQATLHQFFTCLAPEGLREQLPAWIKTAIQMDQHQDPLHRVNVGVMGDHLVLAQPRTGDSTETTMLPTLLNSLSLKGKIITIDALGTPKNLTRSIIDQGAHYIIGLKQDQAGLYPGIVKFFGQVDEAEFQNLPHEFHQTAISNSGRVEIRRHWLVDGVRFEGDDSWANLKGLGLVESESRLPGREPSVKRCYYVSSIGQGVEEFAQAIRSHWEGDNLFHWSLDIADPSGLSAAYGSQGADSWVCIRDFALSLLHQDASSDAEIEIKRRRAGWDNVLLAKILGS